MKITGTTVEEYIENVPKQWRSLIAQLRVKLQSHVHDGFVETLRWGMINYEVPLEVSGPTYNGQPLGLVALAAQKHHISLYLTAIYADPERRERLERAFSEKNLKPNMGKSCVRFKKIEDIPIDDILTMISEISVEMFLSLVQK
jgi:hypothetical protein